MGNPRLPWRIFGTFSLERPEERHLVLACAGEDLAIPLCALLTESGLYALVEICLDTAPAWGGLVPSVN